MSTTPDPLAAAPGSDQRAQPDRLFYAAGVLLDAPDLAAEQLYHRGRLARSLAYLHGSGTISGLKVLFQSAVAPGESGLVDPDDETSEQVFPDGREARILVQPGLAVDRLGRLLEIPSAACLRLQPWIDDLLASKTEIEINTFTHPQPDEADTSISSDDSATPITVSADNRGIVADIFIRFRICEAGGRTPAFANGPFDATDANVPARLRDAYELSLRPRDEDTASLLDVLPRSPWSSATDRQSLQNILFQTWEETTAAWDNESPNPRPEHTEGQDTTDVFLARVLIIQGEDDQPPTAQVDNHSRSFVYPTSAIARWIEINTP